MKKLIIFDVCHTLVDTNSTFSYVDYLMDKGIKSWYKIFFHNRILCCFYTLIYWVFKFHFKIFLTKKYFKGLNREDINILSKEYFSRYEKKIFPNMLELINEENKKSKIILLSASINQPIDYLKNKFGIEGFSSILEEKDGIYTGKVTQALRGKKESIFIEGKFSLKGYDSINFYTDNLDDTGLINFLNNNHKNINIYIIPYKNKKYWNKFFSTNNISHEFVD